MGNISWGEKVRAIEFNLFFHKKIKLNKIKNYIHNCFKQDHSKHLCTRILGYKASFGNDYLKNTSSRKCFDIL